MHVRVCVFDTSLLCNCIMWYVAMSPQDLKVVFFFHAVTTCVPCVITRRCVAMSFGIAL